MSTLGVASENKHVGGASKLEDFKAFATKAKVADKVTLKTYPVQRYVFPISVAMLFQI
jgi:hypothetical protein